MMANEIRALFAERHDRTVATGDCAHIHHDLDLQVKIEIAAQLAELNALLKNVADAVLPLER